jgi:hypothetical protein
MSLTINERWITSEMSPAAIPDTDIQANGGFVGRSETVTAYG